jgi:hypothetical protein
MGKRISQFSQITTRNDNDWLLIEEAATGAYRKIKVSDFIANLGAPTAKIVLNCLFEGADNSTSFVDEKGNTINVIGNAKISTAQKKNGNSSGFLDGVNSALAIPINPNINILSGDFKLGIWFYSASLSGLRAIVAQWQQATGQGGFLLNTSSSTLQFYFGAYSESSVLLQGGSLTVNTWNYAEVSRSGSSFVLSLNNQQVSSVTSSATKGQLSGNISIGNYYSSAGTIGASGASYFSGYIDDWLITK